MKIGIDVTQAVYGTGISGYVVELVRHLPQSELVLFGTSLRRGGELQSLFPSAKIFPFPPTLMHYLWNVAHQVPPEWLVGKLDIWHSSDWAQPPTGAKKVTTVHDLTPWLYPVETDPQIVAVHQARMRWVVKECDQIICVSQNTASDLKRLFGISNDRIKVIYEAVPEAHKLTPQITKQANYVVTIGARQPRKNISRLIEAFRKYKSKYNLPPKLIVIGESSHSAADAEISFTGFVSDQQLVDLLAGASVFVYPSLYEGFGLPILEAFYHNVPVACSNTSAFPEVAGDAAVYFDPLSEEGIAKAMAEAIANRAKLVTAGKTQLDKFSWEKTARMTLKIYESV